ncbi:MAG: transcriptional regulator [Candidatus Iainarchaeum archaeon]|uniref:Transcriptional regulator n=1 Tax=Candidatus Iainarchaeum sp. TaxID=3101447 RepID=A0A497JJE0_9ARCH|nr:MAG: transcriptional regulator [Candidatus Diapherotrites archaeon]
MEKLAITIAGEITLSNDPGGSMKKWREIFGISQIELAEHLKVSPSTISDYEGGRRKSPGIGVISRFVNALIEMDMQRGGKIVKQLMKDFEPSEEAFDIHEFYGAVNANEFAKKIKAVCVANQAKLKETVIYGYTLIDSLKVIIEVPVHEYMHLYGRTPERALIFKKVVNGRSPMIAVKIGRFSTDMKPAIVVLHGPKDPNKIDEVAIKIAESERIPLLVCNTPIYEIKQALKEYEV